MLCWMNKLKQFSLLYGGASHRLYTAMFVRVLGPFHVNGALEAESVLDGTAMQTLCPLARFNMHCHMGEARPGQFRHSVWRLTLWMNEATLREKLFRVSWTFLWNEAKRSKGVSLFLRGRNHVRFAHLSAVLMQLAASRIMYWMLSCYVYYWCVIGDCTVFLSSCVIKVLTDSNLLSIREKLSKPVVCDDHKMKPLSPVTELYTVNT